MPRWVMTVLGIVLSGLCIAGASLGGCALGALATGNQEYTDYGGMAVGALLGLVGGMVLTVLIARWVRKANQERPSRPEDAP
jgi:membrane protein implicated in regulation of membrane protease activity